jgi:hypothetical protein
LGISECSFSLGNALVSLIGSIKCRLGLIDGSLGLINGRNGIRQCVCGRLGKSFGNVLSMLGLGRVSKGRPLICAAFISTSGAFVASGSTFISSRSFGACFAPLCLGPCYNGPHE